ncbi:MAG: hypothetical protein K9J80_00345 [Sulfuritalea sp.]|nr:hypothetical protein [Sulfuritalea sp.]
MMATRSVVCDVARRYRFASGIGSNSAALLAAACYRHIIGRAARRLTAGVFAFAIGIPAAWAAASDEIVAARFVDPVARYGHFAAGPAHEYARIEARTGSGARLVHVLPETEVFEDVEPRLVRLAGDQPQRLLAVVSHVRRGAALMLLGIENKQLVVIARSAAIGTPMRWLNPVATADLDNDGIAEIAAVITPHINGILKIYRQSGAKLVEIAALGGFSNHVYGSAELGLAMLWEEGGRKRLLIPDQSRMVLRVVEFAAGRLRETGRCVLAAPATGAITDLGEGTIEITHGAGTQRLRPANCRP